MTQDQTLEFISSGAISVQPAKGLIRVDGNITKNRLDLSSGRGITGVFFKGRLTSNQVSSLSH